MLDIVPLNTEGRNCREDIMATVINKIGISYELLFSESWAFDYIKDDKKTLGECLVVDWGELPRISKTYNGVQIEYIEHNNLKTSYENIKEADYNSEFIAFAMDPFWCDWNQLYQKVHVRNHMVLGCGIRENGDIHCVDCQPIHYGADIPISIFHKASNGTIMTFKRVPVSQKELDVKVLIKICIDKMGKSRCYKNAFEAMHAFAENIKKMVFEEECKGFGEDDFWNSKLFSNLLNLANGRKQYARFLSFFQKKFGIEVLDQVITKMKYAGSKWNTIRGFLIKYKMVGRLSNKNKEELAQSILEIKMIEQEIWYELKAFIKKEDIYTMNHVQEKKIYEDNQVYEHEYIDIREMCNNNGIGNSISSECETDLTGTGHYFYSDTSKNTIVKKDIFEFYINFNERFDNISCKGQTIKINNLVARKIAILACAEWGDFLDRIKIVYDDGTSSYLYIELNDWWKQPNLGYTVVWSGKVVEKEEGTAKLLDEEGRYMCGKIYELEDKKLIQEITLPICPNIHIFGITIHI